MACIDVLETLETVSHTVEKIPAKVDPEIFVPRQTDLLYPTIGLVLLQTS